MNSMRTALLWLALATGASLGSGGCAKRTVENRLVAVREEADRVLPWLEDQKPFLISADAQRMVLKHNLTVADSYMELRNLQTGATIGRHDGGFPLLVSFLPHRSLVSFVKDQAGDQAYRLLLWEAEAGKLSQPDVPVEWLKADRLMKPSPDGRYLGFRAKISEQEDGLQLLDLDTGTTKSWLKLPGLGNFAWSPDSQRIAVVDSNGAGKIRLVESGKAGAESLVVQEGTSLSQISWGRTSSEILVTGRKPGEHGSGLYRLDLNTHLATVISRPGDDVSQPEVLPDGRYLYHIKKDGLIKVMIDNKEGGWGPLVAEEGTTRYQGFDQETGQVYVEQTGLVEPRGVYRTGPGIKGLELVFTSAKQTRPEPERTRPARIYVPLPGGLRIPVLVWPATGPEIKGVIVKFPTLRRENSAITYDGKIEYLNKNGYHYVAFDFYDGDARPYISDDYLIGKEDVSDALAVIGATLTRFGLPSEKMVLVGESNGTDYVMKTLLAMAEKKCGVLLRGVTAQEHATDRLAENMVKLAVLQGENDKVPLSAAEPGLLRFFGRETYGNAFFFELKGEGHTPRILRSRAEMVAVMEQLTSW